jgi:hypothetical protein
VSTAHAADGCGSARLKCIGVTAVLAYSQLGEKTMSPLHDYTCECGHVSEYLDGESTERCKKCTEFVKRDRVQLLGKRHYDHTVGPKS